MGDIPKEGAMKEPDQETHDPMGTKSRVSA